ncbi:heat shock 70 kDa protein 12A-like [Saccostrea echinata]|uniref:heat shock 70 kDa protein 12A-like n=1 Tax=Saccostrea echinata TaxID=191078 RepID=UPI002A834EB4|nr:heat shock 70 kDa protein 12A-like [Saccostrea echinata]
MAFALSEKSNYVVAIDFGTTYSGFAIAKNYPGAQIECNRWPIISEGRDWHKTPTCILFNEKLEFDSFGYKSEDKYADLQSRDEHENWYFFKCFKMKLKKEEEKLLKERNQWELNDHTDTKKVNAIIVFKGAIEYMKNQALSSIRENDRESDINESTISWMLTVPAIWSDVAKNFMRKAAEEAGIPRKKLTLVYEPEMAAVWFVNENKMEVPTGTKFILVDLGGGTIDITVQEVLQNNKIRQLIPAMGVACGGTTLDECLTHTIEKKFANNIDMFRKNEPKKYVKHQRKIEFMKRSYGKSEGNFILHVSKKLSRSETDQPVTISEEEYKSFLAPVLEQIDNIIAEIEKIKICKQVSHLVIIGGFSVDARVKGYLLEKYQSKYTIITPGNPDLAVLNGAVLFGQHESLITERVCKCTYGFAVFKKFDETHKIEKKHQRGGVTMAKDCFKVVFQKGERVTVDKSYKEIPVFDEFGTDRVVKRKEPIVIYIFSSEEENPQYTDDPYCKKLCEMKMYPPGGEWPSKVKGKVRFKVAGTEFEGELYDNQNNKQDECVFDYLI